jgi:DNA-binding beta-propeller fold protein YncE
VFGRGKHPVIVFERDGSFLRSWGEGQFKRPHGITIGPDDSVYLCDDQGHGVTRHAPDGRLLATIGPRGTASDSGVVGIDYRTIRRGAGPFNLPTNLALGPAGETYVTDGYGNARVHKFSPGGEHLLSWGEPGSGAGQFNLPHGIAVDGRGRVIVADRENSRLQFFSADGKFIEEWTDVVRPCEVFCDRQDNLYVAELGRRAGMFPWMTPDPSQPGGRMSIFDNGGKLLARWGGGDDPLSPADFYAPHDVWFNASGDLYVSEVVRSAGGYGKDVQSHLPTLRKFRRVARS